MEKSKLLLEPLEIRTLLDASADLGSETLEVIKEKLDAIDEQSMIADGALKTLSAFTCIKSEFSDAFEDGKISIFEGITLSQELFKCSKKHGFKFKIFKDIHKLIVKKMDQHEGLELDKVNELISSAFTNFGNVIDNLLDDASNLEEFKNEIDALFDGLNMLEDRLHPVISNMACSEEIEDSIDSLHRGIFDQIQKMYDYADIEEKEEFLKEKSNWFFGKIQIDTDWNPTIEADDDSVTAAKIEKMLKVHEEKCTDEETDKPTPIVRIFAKIGHGFKKIFKIKGKSEKAHDTKIEGADKAFDEWHESVKELDADNSEDAA